MRLLSSILAVFLLFSLSSSSVDCSTKVSPSQIPSGQCVRVDACIDGIEKFEIHSDTMKHSHEKGGQIGTHKSCTVHRYNNGGFWLTYPVAAGQEVKPEKEYHLGVPFNAIGFYAVLAGPEENVEVTSDSIRINDKPPSSRVYSLQICPDSAHLATAAESMSAVEADDASQSNATPVRDDSEIHTSPIHRFHHPTRKNARVSVSVEVQ